MKKLVAAALLVLPFSLQAATLSTGPNIELLVIDGKKVDSSFWSQTESVDLAPGKHQVVVRFDGELKSGSKSKMYTTRPYLFELNVPDENATIVLPLLTSLTQAKSHFERGPEWQLELESGAMRTLEYVELQGKGFAAFSNMEKLVADYNRQHGITFEQGYAVDLEKATVEVSEQGEVTISGDALAQLKLWYSKADAEEKAAFYQWAKAQDAQ
ncbi:hypothetical protein BIT28_20370 [Photobacterium proteolyticum]|uniref:UPF0319 protein BIT28_20370 n=1 Tax=Photobacterium proteolyticum TaxID=1903952 RepID=A0A1Q9G5T5_9GAMM|nr:DUF2057 domain-containing protein [Photobacterium proteolyticum]OLQ69338.1 hypothetical protein BIT28_20370 [Photobacterium proteolyticum]